MPVITLDYSRLQKLVGKVSKKQISESLPFLGLDVESEDETCIRVEYSPNRPDYSTDFGIALGLQGLFGIKTGGIKLKIKKSTQYKINVTPSISKIRPYVTGIIAKNGKINGDILEQLIQMQEDLHMGIGRKRKKSSIGIHDFGKPVVVVCPTKNWPTIHRPFSRCRQPAICCNRIRGMGKQSLATSNCITDHEFAACIWSENLSP